jgi:two-component system, cell cycle sensor histidine kinase and response regulator CckA
MAEKRKKSPGGDSRAPVPSYEEKRFQSIFQHSAVSLWEEDISGLRAALDALRARGVADIGRYLDEHPEFLAEAARLITVIDVNEATLELYEVADRQQLLGPLGKTLDLQDPLTRSSLRDDILLIAEGGTRAERESKATTPSGRKLHIAIRLSVPGPDDPYPHMLVNVMDITRRRHAEEELHRSRQLLQMVLDHVPQRVFWKDTNLRFLGCNRLFAEDNGLPDPVSVVGRTDFDFQPPDSAERFRADDLAVIQTGVPKVNYEEPQIREDGSLQWLRTSKVPMREQDGRVSGILGTYEDITEHRQSEEALRESERHYRELFAAAQRQAKELELLNRVHATLSRGLELPEVFRNVVEGIAATFGYTHVSIYLLRENALEFQYQVGYQNVLMRIPTSQGVNGKVARTGLPLLLPDVRTDPDFIAAIPGVRSELCIPLFDQGRVVGTLNVESTGEVQLGEADLRLMRILGEQIGIAIAGARLYTEARESEQRYRTLVENLGEGIAIVDPEENFRFANPAAERIFGVEAGGLTGRNLKQFLSDEEWARTLTETERRRRGETTTYEQGIIRPDGTVRLIELTATPQYDRTGAFSHTFGVFHDITAERHTQEALRRSEERLSQSQKLEAVGRLAGGVAHDFNNLLTVIRGYADLLDMRMHDTHPMKADAREIKRAADRAADLTAQLLAFSRGQVLRPRILDLNDVVRGMRNMLGRLIGEDIELRTELAPGLTTVRADQGQIEQVAMNLAANARDAMPGGGVLTIATAGRTFGPEGAGEHAEIPPGDYVTLEVSDTGVGIDRDTLSRIFEPFFTTKEVGHGTGLGLATVYGIVKQSGGFIYCDSEPGAGTTFTVYLPSVRGEILENAAVRGARSRPGSESVLVVEDEEAIRNFILSILRRNGYEATGAGGGAEALSIFSVRTAGFHLLLTDIVMPQMSGLELGRRIAESDPAVKVLYMTGYSAHPLVQAGPPNGEIDILRKPFTAEELLKRIRETLDAQPRGTVEAG